MHVVARFRVEDVLTAEVLLDLQVRKAFAHSVVSRHVFPLRFVELDSTFAELGLRSLDLPLIVSRLFPFLRVEYRVFCIRNRNIVYRRDVSVVPLPWLCAARSIIRFGSSASPLRSSSRSMNLKSQL